MATSAPFDHTQTHTITRTQFFVTVAALPFLNCRNVAFGRVIRGMNVIRAVDRVDCVNERPLAKVIIDKAKSVDLESPFDLK